MCLIDTIDGALMLTLYILPETAAKSAAATGEATDAASSRRARDPITFLYYSIVLTALTVVVAFVIGAIQLLSLVRNAAAPEGPFWDGVAAAGDNYDVIGGGICASFALVGGASVLAYKPWRRRVDRKRGNTAVGQGGDEGG